MADHLVKDIAKQSIATLDCTGVLSLGPDVAVLACHTTFSVTHDAVRVTEDGDLS